jgi:ParB family transcriptional regulator, chromosome partitioning protein
LVYNKSMSSNNRGLGRGFDALIPTQLVEEEFDPTAASTETGKRVSADTILHVSPEIVDPNPHQPRQYFDEMALKELADSIREHGILQPLVVTESGNGRYQLVAGERRLRAAKQVQLSTVPVIARSFTGQQKLELAIIENLQRADLNAIEMATAYRKLADQFNMTLEAIGKRVGRDISTISNTMRLLNLPIEAKRAVAEGRISEGHARVLLTTSNIEKQLALLKMIQKHNWSVRQTEEFARGFREEKATKDTALKRIAGTNELTKSLGDYLGTKVNLVYRAKGGSLKIDFYSEEELDRIYKAIKHDTENQ